MVCFAAENKLPFGLLADKMSAKHRKRHNWYSCSSFGHTQFSDKQINYIRHSAVGYSSEETIVNHLFHKLKTIGFPSSYTRKYFSGMSMDRKYTSLHVDKYMHEKLQKNMFELGCNI